MNDTMVFPSMIAEVKNAITALQRKMEYHGCHRAASQLKYLGVKSLSECDDYDLLLWYFAHLKEKDDERENDN